MGLLMRSEVSVLLSTTAAALTFSARGTASTAIPDCCFAARTGHAMVTWHLHRQQKVGTEAILILGETYCLHLIEACLTPNMSTSCFSLPTLCNPPPKFTMQLPCTRLQLKPPTTFQSTIQATKRPNMLRGSCWSFKATCMLLQVSSIGTPHTSCLPIVFPKYVPVRGAHTANSYAALQETCCMMLLACVSLV